MKNPEPMRLRMEKLIQRMQNVICRAIEEVDNKSFGEDIWERPEGGGGISRVLQDGNVWEKAGVNTAAVYGTLSAEALRTLAGDKALADDDSNFFATGLSIVMHPHHPMAPSVHANFRYFELGDGSKPGSWWFGGGTDLSPAYLFVEDIIAFHCCYKKVCDQFDPSFYPRFKKWCDDYFYIPHREERRGVGGIFFDHLNDRGPETLFAFIASCAEAFIPAYLPIVKKRQAMSFTDLHKRWQRLRRGRYVEFNLMYDRGTTFGLNTGGRTESILMSLPLTAGWEYDYHPNSNSEEAKLVDVLKKPREWV